MVVLHSKDKKRTVLEKELAVLKKKEERILRNASKASPSRWKTELESKVPEKAFHSLERAFSKAFSVVFSQGTGVIEHTYDRESLGKDHDVQNYAVMVKGGRRELRQLKRRAGHSNWGNMALTTAEGVGLGLLGIGLPDIVLFVGMLLRGIYETALRYGFSYDTPAERLLILQMMETALTNGPDFAEKDKNVERFFDTHDHPSEEEIQEQILKTGSAFAVDMLLLKFIQGIPIVGVLGGAANPVYYSKVMGYVQLKYQKRYLLAALRSSCS